MKNGPELWQSIYDPIAKAYGADNVVVAGGCVRDYVIHKAIRPNDVDVFVTGPLSGDDTIDFEMATEDLRESFYRFREVRPGEAYETNTTEVHSVYQGYLEDSYEKVNVIAKTYNPLFHVDRLIDGFDYSLTNFWWTPEVGIQSSEAAQATLDNGVITFSKALSLKSYERAENLIKRNKSYGRFVIDPAVERPAPPAVKSEGYGKSCVKAFNWDELARLNVDRFALDLEGFRAAPGGMIRIAR